MKEGNFTIRGRMELEADGAAAGDNVTLHMAEIELDESSVAVEEEGGGGGGIAVRRFVTFFVEL